MSWIGKGDRVEIGPFVVHDPLIYVSHGSDRDKEVSCVDLELPIARPSDLAKAPLGYYPTYENLNTYQRSNYIRWMSRGRTDPLDDIGYAFLYFYGLERRLLVEGKDLSPIVKEVVRLLETYTFSASFDGYLSRFLAFCLARSGIGTLKDKWFEAVFERTRAQRDEQHLAVGLAWLSERDKPLPASWALRIARLDPRSPRSVVLDRLPEEFAALFSKRYALQFGPGMKLRSSKRDRSIVYTPANPSLLDLGRHDGPLQPVKVPNVLGLPSQFASLVTIWSEAIEELKPLSRVMARGAEPRTRAAFEALPESLQADTEHPDKDAWETLASNFTREDGATLVEVGRLAEIHGIGLRPRLTSKQAESIAGTAHHIGFLIEPDPRITGRTYAWDDVIALVRPEEKAALPEDSRYAGASLMMELGVFIAAADGDIGDDEVNHIAQSLESQFHLDPSDARRLEALEKVLLARPPSIAGAGKRARAVLTPDQRQAIGRYLVGVAAANGEIDKREIVALRAAYKALGLDLVILEDLLDDLRREKGDPVEVRPATPIGTGELIPTRPEPRPPLEGGVVLDPERLKRLLRETEEVGKILGDAMREAEPELETAASIPGPDARFDGLDIKYHPALVELLGMTFLLRSEFESIARAHGLMPSGMLDAINEWAFEAFDDPILDESASGFSVRSDLIPRSL